MPDLAEPTTQEAPTMGSIFSRELDKLQGKEIVEKPVDKPAEKASDKPIEKAPDKPAEKPISEKKQEPEKTVVKPKSPLDVVLGEEKSVVKDEEVPVDAPVKKLREAYERHKTEAEQLRAELAKKSQPDPEIKGRIEAIQKERDTLKEENTKLRDAITAVNVDYDPDHRAKFYDGRNKLVDKAAGRVKEYGGNVEAFKEAMQLSGAKQTHAIREALTDVDEIDRPRITSLLEKIQELDDEREEIQKDPQQAWQRLEEKRKADSARQAEESESYRKQVLDHVGKSLVDKSKLFNAIKDESFEGATAYNERLNTDNARAEYLLTPGAPAPEEVTEAAMKGTRYDFVEEMLYEARSELALVREQLQKYEGADPGYVGGGKKPTTSPLDESPGTIYRREMEAKKKVIV